MREPQPSKIYTQGSVNTEFYLDEREARLRATVLATGAYAGGVTEYRAQNHDWMDEGIVYHVVRWTSVHGAVNAED